MNELQFNSPTKPFLRGLSIVAWFLITSAYLAFFVLDLRLDYAQILVPCGGEACNYIAVSQAEFDAMANLGLSPKFYANTMTMATVTGVAASWLLALLILWRQGGTRIGWVVSIVLAIIPITMISDVENVAAYYPALESLVNILSSIGSFVLFGFLYLFPSGRFYPRWAIIPFSISLFIFELFSSYYEQPQIPDWWEELGPPILLFIVLFAGILQIYRYRRESTQTERQQTKWLLLGLLLLITGFPVWFTIFGGIVEISPGQPRLIASLGGWVTNMLFVIALPITMAIAISRYRLWDFDLVIRRTLQYALVTGILALTYFGGIVILQGILGPLTGSANSPVVTVITTLGIAALFNPLRTRVQEFIDRRFYRAKYDAEQTLAAFAKTARDEVDMEKLTGALLGVVDETMQPEQASVWLKNTRG